MTAKAKNDIKWMIGTATALITIICFSFFLGKGFAQNTADHKAIVTEMGGTKELVNKEIERALIADKVTSDDISLIQADIKVIQTTFTNLDKTIVRIEKKLP
jgi:hypothetical protein